MEITYKIVGLKRLQNAAQLAPRVLADRNAIALRSSTELVKRVIEHNTPEGPGHFGYHLRERFTTLVRMGYKRSFGKVSTDAPQGKWLELGTKAHDIAPRNMKALAIGPGAHAAGYGVEAVSIRAIAHNKGEKPRGFMRKALRSSMSTIRGYFVGATLEMTKTFAGSGD